MIVIIALVCVVGLVFYCHKIGRMQGFKEGMEFFEKTTDEEISKRWNKFKDDMKLFEKEADEELFKRWSKFKDENK